VRLAHEREQHGEDVSRLVLDAIAIGARVLDREQTGANADFVKAEFEKAARELDAAFVDRARLVAERLDKRIDDVFGPENGHVTKALARHFGDESSVAVQNRVKALLTEVGVQMREDIVGGALSHDADEKSGPDAASNTQDEPAMDVHDASHEDKVAGIAAQTRLDVGGEGHERIADVLSQRFTDAGMTVTDEDRVALAKRISGE
jgi:hypothetical protein